MAQRSPRGQSYSSTFSPRSFFAAKCGSRADPSIGLSEGLRLAGTAVGIGGELDLRGAGVEDEDARRSRPLLRRLEQRRAALLGREQDGHGADASRVRALSARLVRMIGTRAPITMPAASASAMNVSCLASMLPASRSGTTRMSALPATGETMPLVCAASTSIALSNASGPSTSPPVIWPRSAILHSAAASMVEGILGVTVSTAERIATFGWAMPMACAKSIAFWQMSRLLLQRRQDVDGGVGNDDRPGIGRHGHEEAVAEPPLGAQAALLLHHLVQQLVGVQAALHQASRLAAAYHRHRHLGRVVAVLGGDDAVRRMSISALAATARIFFSGPTRIGLIRSRWAASTAPLSASSLQGGRRRWSSPAARRTF